MKPKEKYEVLVLSIYKIILSTLRIILGFIIIFLGFNLNRVINFLFHESVERKQILSNFLIYHINPTNIYLTAILAISLIILSTLEIIFSVLLLKRKEIGAAGLIVLTFLWIFLEILFISKFLLIHKTSILIINIIIILFLFRLILKHKSYFKK
jgi:hypothetical protein